MEKIISLLQQRIEKTNINNPRANRGHVELKAAKDYPDKLPEWVTKTIDITTKRIHQSKRGEDSGITKLTSLSSNIGDAILSDIADTYTTSATINVGDAVLGAMLTEGYIEVVRIPEDTSQFSQNTAPYYVKPRESFKELTNSPLYAEKPPLRGTSLTPIAPISNVIQDNGRSIVQQLKDNREVDVRKSIIDQDTWVRAADILQSTGWKINKAVVDVLEEVWEDNLPEVPEKPSHGDKAKVSDTLAALKKSDTEQTRASYNKACEEWNDMLAYLSAISKRADRQATWSKIQYLKDVEEFFQYVEFDTRGRVYYQEYGLNFQGSDWARGVMQFSKGQRLNSDGIRWLAIHTANSINVKFPITDVPEYFEYDYKKYMEDNGLDNISLDKLTLNDRVNWVWENMYDVIIPNRNKLYKEAEKPVSFLACCIEWHGVLFDKDHISYLPLPIDGSNNGYQHSGAIAKDERTASYVGLNSSEIPKDLYMICAKELMNRCPEFFSDRPDFSMGQIRKAIAKRATMTRAYSAGATTMAENMYKDTHKEGYTRKYNISMLDCEKLAKELYDLIGEVCPGATKTMEYLQNLVQFELGEFAHYDIESGNKISKTKRKKLQLRRKKLNKVSADELTTEQIKELMSINELLNKIECRLIRGNGSTSINWVTPTGFPAISDYKIQRTVKILSSIPGFEGGASAQPGRIRHVLVEDTDFPDRNKHIAAVSPNSIHALDASHLAAVVDAWGGQFGAVHDSFSVHPNDVPVLLQIAKQTFVDLYDVEDPYVEIANTLLSDGDGFDISLPEYGTYNLNELQESNYFFC